MPRTTSESDDDNPLPKGSGTQGSVSGSFRGTSAADTSAPSFLYSAEDPLPPPPPPEVKSKEKRKRKKKKQTTDVDDDVMNNAPIDEGQSFDMSQSFDRSFESGASARRPEGTSKTSATHYSDSFTRIQASLDARVEVQGQGQDSDVEEAESDAMKGGGAAAKKIKFPISFGKFFRKNRKPETKEMSVVETELSAIPTTTIPSSGYLEPQSGTSSRYEMGGYAAGGTGYRVAQPLQQGQRHTMTTTVSMLPPGGVEEEECELERMMKDKQRKISQKKICESVFLSVVLVAGFVLGIILTAMGSLGLTFQVVGPTILVLSAFAIIGKIFVTVFWQEDPFMWTKRHVRKITERQLRKKNRKAAPTAAETRSSVMPNPSYGGDENAPSPLLPPSPPAQAVTSHYSDDANNQYGGGGQQTPPSFSFDSTFSQRDA